MTVDDSLPKPNRWYWVRRRDGSLAPYRFHRLRKEQGRLLGEFYVGSFLQTWPLSSVVAEARMPGHSESPGANDPPA